MRRDRGELAPPARDHARRAGRDAASGRRRASFSSSRVRHAPRDAVDLRQRAVLVVHALDREHRAADRARSRASMFQSRNAGEPDVVPAPERGVDVVVVAREPRRAGRVSRYAVARALDARDARRPRRRRAARRRSARDARRESARHEAARSSRRRCGRRATGAVDMPSASSSAGSTSRACAVHEVGRPALVGRARRRAAVARTRVDEPAHAAAPRKARRESRATSRPSPGPRAGTRRCGRRARRARSTQPYSMRDRSPAGVAVRRRSIACATAPFASRARSRSRSLKRWILPVAVFGSSATNSI